MSTMESTTSILASKLHAEAHESSQQSSTAVAAAHAHERASIPGGVGGGENEAAQQDQQDLRLPSVEQQHSNVTQHRGSQTQRERPLRTWARIWSESSTWRT